MEILKELNLSRITGNSKISDFVDVYNSTNEALETEIKLHVDAINTLIKNYDRKLDRCHFKETVEEEVSKSMTDFTNNISNRILQEEIDRKDDIREITIDVQKLEDSIDNIKNNYVTEKDLNDNIFKQQKSDIENYITNFETNFEKEYGDLVKLKNSLETFNSNINNISQSINNNNNNRMNDIRSLTTKTNKIIDKVNEIIYKIDKTNEIIDKVNEIIDKNSELEEIKKIEKIEKDTIKYLIIEDLETEQ